MSDTFEIIGSGHERVNFSVSVGELPDTVICIGLSDAFNPIERLHFSGFTEEYEKAGGLFRKICGRTEHLEYLRFTVTDPSPLPELRDKSKSYTLRLRLGNTAVLGRDLPRSEIEKEPTISGVALILSYLSDRYGQRFLHFSDPGSTNGSRLLKPTEVNAAPKQSRSYCDPADLPSDGYAWLYNIEVDTPKSTYGTVGTTMKILP